MAFVGGVADIVSVAAPTVFEQAGHRFHVECHFDDQTAFQRTEGSCDEFVDVGYRIYCGGNEWLGCGWSRPLL